MHRQHFIMLSENPENIESVCNDIKKIVSFRLSKMDNDLII